MNEAVQRLEAELRHERAKAAKADRVHERTREDLAILNAELLRSQQQGRGGAPPG